MCVCVCVCVCEQTHACAHMLVSLKQAHVITSLTQNLSRLGGRSDKDTKGQLKALSHLAEFLLAEGWPDTIEHVNVNVRQ